MKHKEDEKDCDECADGECKTGDCSTTNARSVWIVGITITVLVTLFCLAMFKGGDVPLPGQPVGPGNTVGAAGQQVAFVPPACATCPTVTQCFPGAPAPSAAQPVAFAPGCAQQVGFTPGCAQPAAWVPCPLPGSGRQMGVGRAMGQNPGAIQCPQCNYVFSDPNYWNRGYSRCPRCGQMIRVPNQAAPQVGQQANQGFQQIALAQGVPPPIFRDAVMLHQFRGVCENCHVVNPDIAIPASTNQVPHGFRGVCSNCHTILGLAAAK